METSYLPVVLQIFLIILNKLSIVNSLSMIIFHRGDPMISYAPLYRTLRSKGITEYQLIFKHGFSANILHRMKHGEAISTKTLDALCFILKCSVADVLEYVEDQ